MTDTLDRPLLPSISIEEEMRRSYLDYAMSVIVSRAIPDVRDGLKPVHRRILFSMNETGCNYDRPYRKSARIVGEVMGKYHPHGDAAIYDALVRMAQDFSMRVPLVDGQGNYGSLDGDPPAAMRYTEARMAKIAHRLLDDIDKDTVEFQDNYDGSEQEPMVLPSKYPNILVNGAGGIAVGMATNIPTFNLGEVIDATLALIDNPELTAEDILEIVPGPDFPTGGIIVGRAACRSAVTTGRGSVVMRGRTTVETAKTGRESIIITEVPYQVNKARMIERIAELVRDKKIEGISDLRDESDSEGVRVVIEIKKDAHAEVVLNQLYSYTPLQSSFGVNMLVLSDMRPQLLNVRDILTAFIRFREEVITRRTRYLLSKARDRAHILIGLAIAVANIDEVIAVIRKAADPAEAKEGLMSRSWKAADVGTLIDLVSDSGNELREGQIRFTDAQAKAILELRLARLTGLERNKIDEELQELAVEIREHLATLSSREKLLGILRDELTAIKNEFATPRRSEIIEADGEFNAEDLIQKEEMVVTVTMTGYIKRVPLAAYRAQRRGGKGRSGMTVREEDVTTQLFVASTHTPVLFFSNYGKVYKLKVYKLPLGTPQARGKALVNIFPLAEGEKITTFMPLPEDESLWANLHIFFATACGNVRRNDLSDFHNVPSNGKIAIRLEENDSLVDVVTCNEEEHILLATRSGKCIRFPVGSVRVFKSRTSDGVRGMRLEKDDKVISMCVLSGVEIDMETRTAYLKMAATLRKQHAKKPGDESQLTLPSPEIDKFERLAGKEQYILTITAKGYGKRTSAFEYRTTNRGGSGILNIECNKKNGLVVGSFPVDETDQIMLMTDAGRLFRTKVSDIRITGRNTQGVIVLRADEKETVVSAVRIAEDDSDEMLDGIDGAEDAAEA